MNEHDFLAERFETHRGHLLAVAYRMLGSLTEADDALQETWLKLSRSDPDEVDNLAGWLTTVVGRVCLDMLRSRRSRGEEPLDPQVHVPDPIITGMGAGDPEESVLIADSIGLALMVVLETLAPAERLAFVLHDLFAVPFDEIAPIVDRTPAAARQLASRARRRVQGAAPSPDVDLAVQREIVDAFLAAVRGGDFDALVAVLDPDVVARADGGPLRPGGSIVRGAATVAGQALAFAQIADSARPALVNGTAGVVAISAGRPMSVLAFGFAARRIVSLDILADPARLSRLDLTVPAS
ncbi:RNA polymerase subunit sigma-70 [Embleya scabrispora]|uniref:RNA polymerase subunit sigma-70 n=1 Tax=Embleya scabrispora TaxID=159449 RepID=A0A1T3NRR2_9ACTN|nr:sigma-70 family RNA polymerase sigma factor [Embleya scabrispora]OPC79435.1 RNA polymerase subunit sigma-70 [Embleya scabrispora]